MNVINVTVADAILGGRTSRVLIRQWAGARNLTEADMVRVPWPSVAAEIARALSILVCVASGITLFCELFVLRTPASRFPVYGATYGAIAAWAAFAAKSLLPVPAAWKKHLEHVTKLRKLIPGCELRDVWSLKPAAQEFVDRVAREIVAEEAANPDRKRSIGKRLGLDDAVKTFVEFGLVDPYADEVALAAAGQHVRSTTSVETT